MIFDFIALLIVGLFAFLGLKNGFVYLIFRFLGWIVAIVAAVFLHSHLVNLIKEYTLFYTDYSAKIYDICNGFVDQYTGDVQGSFPGAFGNTLEGITDSIVEETANAIASTSFNIIVFIALLLIIKLMLFLITILFSKKYHSGFVGGADGVAGCILGVVQGIVIVLILFALLMPISFLMGPDTYESINQTMSNSLFAELIYKGNPILGLVDGYIPEEILPGNWQTETVDREITEKKWDELV